MLGRPQSLLVLAGGLFAHYSTGVVQYLWPFLRNWGTSLPTVFPMRTVFRSSIEYSVSGLKVGAPALPFKDNMSSCREKIGSSYAFCNSCELSRYNFLHQPGQAIEFYLGKGGMTFCSRQLKGEATCLDSSRSAPLEKCEQGPLNDLDSGRR